MLCVGLTGGIGSGKSTVSRFFEDLGVPVIDADQLAREVVAPGTPALAAIQKSFGAGIVHEGHLDRARLRDMIFADPAARQTLETILHPVIRIEMRRRIASIRSDYCVIAIPLLVEKGWRDEVDRVLVIDAAPENQLTRIQARDRLTQADAERIVSAQASRRERLAVADDVIENNGDLISLREQVRMVHQRYRSLADNR